MVEQKAAEAAQALLKSFQETNQIITERLTATQERNSQFAQSFFAEGMETLKSQAECARTLMQELGQKPRSSKKRSSNWRSSRWRATSISSRLRSPPISSRCRLLKLPLGRRRMLYRRRIKNSLTFVGQVIRRKRFIMRRVILQGKSLCVLLVILLTCRVMHL
jgi:hypothetical protein